MSTAPPLRRLQRALVVALAVVVTGACSAPPAARAERDPQAAYEPTSAPGDGQQYLARFAGDWQVTKTFHPRSGEPAVTQGTCRQSMIHDGRFLQSEFTFDGDAGKSTGTGLVGFDAGTRVFTSFWIDSRSTRVSVRQSEGAFDGNEIVLWSRTLDNDKNARRSRTVTRIDADNQRIVHRHFNLADGGERLMMELVMTRRR
jgi:hypothetical protein